MIALEHAWQILVLLLGLGLGIGLIYVAFGVISLIVMAPFAILSALVTFIAGVLGILAVIIWEALGSVGSKIAGLIGLKSSQQEKSQADFDDNFYQSDNSKQSHDSREVFDPYQVLEVVPGMEPQQIKEAYYRQMTQYHPDKVAHLGKELQSLAEKRTRDIQQAFSMLHGV